MHMLASGITGLLIGGIIGGYTLFLIGLGIPGDPAILMGFTGMFIGAALCGLAGVQIAEKIVLKTRISERALILMNVVAWLCGIGWLLMEKYATW